MKSDLKMVIVIGMNYDEENDEVITNGVEIDMFDENNEIISVEDDTLIKLAKEMFNELKDETIKIEAE